MKLLPQDELIRISRDFYGKQWEEYTDEEKDNIFESYRKVEKETNEQIEKHGNVQKWYESGEGRII